MVRKIETEIVIIGGGATGTGLARDLAMRGFKTTLVEKGDLSHGTTGRFHGLLHSGGRYVIKDPDAARECIQENIILKKITPFCIEDTGGFFIQTPWDDPEYSNQFITGCHRAGIPVEEISISRLLKVEPLLNKEIIRCFTVPDASADSFLSSEANVKAAQGYGAEILTYHPVISIIKDKFAVRGVTCLDREKNEEVKIYSDFVVNASGAWAGKIAQLAGIHINMVPGKGTMLAVNHRIVNSVINRCKMPSDGDIIVPAHSVAVLGTTDHPVLDPDQFSIDQWETRLIIEEGEKVIPHLREMRFLRAWAGVRPLVRDSDFSNNRDLSRTYSLMDHEERDGISGFITITGGKWTTYRKMSEVTADLVCHKVGIKRECRTHLESLEHPLDHKKSKGFHVLGNNLQEIETKKMYGELICECELVTRDKIIESITSAFPKTIDDLRRDTRLGMGPCQGGFCTLRAAGIFHEVTGQPVEKTNLAIGDFYLERKKGTSPILWGKQLQQELLDDLIFTSLLNIGNLPKQQKSPHSPDLYSAPSEQFKVNGLPEITYEGRKLNAGIGTLSRKKTNSFDVLIIGAGLSGLIAAWRLAVRGASVCLVSKGRGSLYWHAGCIDVLGYMPNQNHVFIDDPRMAIENIIQKNSAHPYAIAGSDNIQLSMASFSNMCIKADYPMDGSLEENWLIPTSCGAVRPSCLIPQSMISGDIRQLKNVLITGINGYLDFYPKLISDNLNLKGIPASFLSLDVYQYFHSHILSGSRLADQFENPNFRSLFVQQLLKKLSSPEFRQVEQVGFPAILGNKNSYPIFLELSEKIGLPIFEIPTLPPSLPGMRLYKLLAKEIQINNGVILEGSQVVGADALKNRIDVVYAEAATRLNPFYGQKIILASGGILGGGLVKEFDRPIRETIFNLPVKSPDINQKEPKDQLNWLLQSGIEVNKYFQPIDGSGDVIFNNVWCIGAGLYKANPISTRSVEGISLVTGYSVGESI